MIQPASWFAHYRSAFNPQGFTIVGRVLRIGTDAMPSGSELQAAPIITGWQRRLTIKHGDLSL